ncbi:hypothetical protein NG701_00630 [Pseudarthrobacter sp. HLT3-5]|uniref:hypothetical protein n=1 Tax=Pseudarthrobacter cellobiosi TaxID=2953654 RepID=UPI00208F1103|nr:hypothetical protein [Pseudarthrobacter sp. HLT3-5]MCO4272953.1 hypothetical protein [Pseudarthrobacter sp. HLT3-5]
MSYIYRSKGTTEQRAERDKQRLTRGLLTYRKAIAGRSARLTALRSRMEQEIAQAIWDDVAVRTVASAAGITVARARSVALAFEDLPHSGTAAESHVKTLRALAEHTGRLKAEQEELLRLQEPLVVTALESGIQNTPWIAAISGLTIDRVNILAQQTRRNASNLGQAAEAQT